MNNASQTRTARSPLRSLRGLLVAFTLLTSLVAARSLVVPNDEAPGAERPAAVEASAAEIFRGIGLLAPTDG